ncbi:N-acetylmuramoyl-L-alanine amidase [Enterococcus sp. DIV0876]|uniref:N-acetylmuramoyl-L-alanine amidase n=1 Tax=Enterococcus sp. DIV0876 TaxID=2774633 RepID=UPI003D2FA760
MTNYINSTSHRGHNAIVPGASGCGLKEHEVAQQIHDKFRAVTKAVDATDNVGRTANANLVNIVNKMNAVGKSFHVSHHLNAFNGQANGFEVWYYAGNAAAKKLAEEICAAVCKVTGWVNRGAKATTSLYVIRASTGSAILIEWGFVDSQKDMDIMAKKMDAAVNAALEVMGYNGTGGNSTVAKKVNYQTKTGFYEVIKADTFYCEPELKTKSGWNAAVGQRIAVDEVVKIKGKDGTVYTRGKTQLGSVTRYITLRDDTLKKL